MKIHPNIIQPKIGTKYWINLGGKIKIWELIDDINSHYKFRSEDGHLSIPKNNWNNLVLHKQITVAK